MTGQQGRPDPLAGIGATEDAFDGKPILPETDAASRPRCIRCMHPLDAPRSVARGFGPVCWSRTLTGQLDTRRDAVGRALDALARRVGRMDAPGLAVVAGALADLDEVAR